MEKDNLIKELGRSYIVSSLLPAVFFCLIIFLLFQSFLPDYCLQSLKNESPVVIGGWLLVSISPSWLGFFLFSSVDSIVKLYEGYYFPKPIKWLFNLNKKRKLRNDTENYRYIQEVKGKDLDEYDKKWDDAYEELHNLELDTPLDENDLLPTKLGNIFRSTELYAQDRYSMEAVTIWSMLFGVLPSQFAKTMEEKNNHFMFLLNSSLLMYLAGISNVVASIVGRFMEKSPSFFLNAWLAQSIFQNGYETIPPKLYLLISVILFAFGYMLYRVAVNAARDVCMFHRAGFDLYRIELLKQLNRKRPKNLHEEKNLWFDISQFLIAGEKLEWDMDNIEYPSYYYHDLENQPDGTDGKNGFSIFNAIFSIFRK